MRWIAWSTIGISLLLYVLACALPYRQSWWKRIIIDVFY